MKTLLIILRDLWIATIVVFAFYMVGAGLDVIGKLFLEMMQ